MTDILSDQQAGTAARSHTHALFAQTMGYVAVTAAFAALIGMRFAARGSAQLAVRLLAAFGLLIGLIVAGIVLIFVHIPGADLAYSVLGLIIFARFTMFDFQRLRTNTDITAAPLLAASIFLDVSTSSCSSCRSSPTRSGNSHGRVEPGFHRRADRHPAGPGHGVALPFIAARDTAQEFSSARQPDLTPQPWPTSSSRSVHVHLPVRPVRLNRKARTCSGPLLPPSRASGRRGRRLTGDRGHARPRRDRVSAHRADAPQHAAKHTIVLVHGAWADASSWDGVASILLRDGYTVDVAPNPLRGLTYDTGYLQDYLADITGPIVLVGHSYGGAVITDAATGNANVKALVYDDAYIPALGENITTLSSAQSALAPGALNPASVFKW